MNSGKWGDNWYDYEGYDIPEWKEELLEDRANEGHTTGSTERSSQDQDSA